MKIMDSIHVELEATDQLFSQLFDHRRRLSGQNGRQRFQPRAARRHKQETECRESLFNKVRLSRHPSALNTSYSVVVVQWTVGLNTECGTTDASHPQPAPRWRRNGVSVLASVSINVVVCVWSLWDEVLFLLAPYCLFAKSSCRRRRSVGSNPSPRPVSVICDRSLLPVETSAPCFLFGLRTLM